METKFMNKFTIKTLIVSGILFLGFNQISAQTTVGSIDGTVAGASASTVVTVTDTSRNVTRTASAASGTFAVGDLVPGTYLVEVRNGNTVIDSVEVLVRVDQNASVALAANQALIEEILVSGQRIDALSVGIAESGIVVTADEIEALPVGRSLNAVALLSPGATGGDASFGGVSFSGSSVAENQTYINGLAITNFRTGVGYGYVPFEFFSQMQTKTGAYGAEYGRSTGGVINGVTRSGSNDFRFGVSSNSTFNQSTSPDTYGARNSLADYSTDITDFYVSGPIWRDRIFYYVMSQNYQYDSDSFDSDLGSQAYNSSIDQSFLGYKIDAYITDNHRVEYTYWDNSTESLSEVFEWSPETGYGSSYGVTSSLSGGENWILSYTGDFGPFQVRFATGENQENRTSPPTDADITPAWYYANGSARRYTPWSSATSALGFDTRESSRFDISTSIGNHDLRVGYEVENLTALDAFEYNGGGYFYRIFADETYTARNNYFCPYLEENYGELYEFTCDTSGAYPGTVYRVQYSSGGTFKNENSAFYMVDTFSIGDNWTIEAGLRNDSFLNLNAEELAFSDIQDQWAPRLSASYDAGSGTRYFANFGQYYLPVAANTNIRMAGGETYKVDYFQWAANATEATGFQAGPNLVTGLRPLFSQVYGDGEVPDVADVKDSSMDPMFQNEFVLGLERDLNNGMTLGVKALYRTLDTTIEDILIEDGVLAYYAGTEYEDDIAAVYGAYPGNHYILTNPGTDATIYIPTTEETITITADQFGIPAPTRDWKALEFTLNKPWDGRSSMFASYTLGSSYGNYEGWVRSDNGQDDAGITSLFDSKDMTENGEGPLPNDRRHTIKFYGNRMITDNFLVGLNATFQTGRPKNCFDIAPNSRTYSYSMFYCNGQIVERGDAGRQPSIFNVDMNAQYTLTLGNQEVILTGTVYNVFDSARVEETTENATGYYNYPVVYQSPRTVRLGFRYNFN